jgi:hypothetical protein
MNLMFNKWIYSKDEIHGTKTLCKENYKDTITMWFLLHQIIVPKYS